MNYELLPCPFCGSEAKLHVGNRYYWVKCENEKCGASCCCSETKNDAIDGWNTRIACDNEWGERREDADL